MKFFKKYLLPPGVWVIAIGLVLVSGCGGDDPKPSEIESVKKLLTSGTWKISMLEIDGNDHSDKYENLQMTFSSNGYTSTGGEPVWPSSGMWSFTDETAARMTRDDDVVVTILKLTKSDLSLELIWDDTTLGSGRSAALSGVHVFTFTK